MVQFGDFLVQLVQAADKKPFPEHYHDGKTYFEVKSGQEYFIAISKPYAKLFSGMVLVRFYVDGNYLGFNLTYAAATKYSTPKYKGHWKRANGVSTDTAIQCDTYTKDQTSKKPSLGKVKIKVFPTIPSASSSSAAAAVTAKGDDNNSLANERMDRSGSEDVMMNGRVRYDRYCLLSTITLHYGTRQQLMDLGVITASAATNQSTTDGETANAGTANNDSLATTRNSPKRRSKLSRVSTGKTTEKDDSTLDPTEADDSDSLASPTFGRKTKSDTGKKANIEDDDNDDGSLVFVDPDMDVIALDDLSDELGL